MNQFVIATHATLAQGFTETIHFFYSDMENIRFVNAYVKSQEFEKELRTVLEDIREDNVVVLTDVAGGSVNQVATRLMSEYGFHLVSGINLPMLLDLMSESEDVGESAIRSAMESGHDGMVYMNDMAPSEDEADGEDDEL